MLQIPFVAILLIKFLSVLIINAFNNSLIAHEYRNSLGRNDNPNATEFKSAFRKLLVCHPITTSADRNTITNATGILTTSSVLKKQSKRLSECTHFQECALEIDYDQLMLKEITTMDSYQKHLCAYLALCIEEKFKQNIKRKLYKCSECAAVLHSTNDRINDDLLAMKNENGPAKQPLASTLKMVIFTDAVMKITATQLSQGNSFEAVCKITYNNLDLGDLYRSANFKHEEGPSIIVDHKDKFILEVFIYYFVHFF